MPYDLAFYLNRDALTLEMARVVSATDRRPAGLPSLVVGETLSCVLYLIDGTGAAVSTTGLTPRLLLGDPGYDPPLVEVTTFTAIPDGWSFSLPLTAALLINWMGGSSDTKTTWLEINTTNAASAVRTELRIAAAVLPSIYDPTATYSTYGDLVQAVLDAQAAQTAAEEAAAATAADRTQTGLDRTATGEDATATAADRTATGEDATATAADRVQTGLDRTAAAASATTALNAIISTYKGTIAASAVPATSSNAGDYYRISTGGAATNVTAPVASPTLTVGDWIVYNGISGSWTQIPAGAVDEARVLAGDTPRQTAPALLIDGVTSGSCAYAALGAAGAIGTSDFTLLFENVEIPTSNPVSTYGLGGLGPNNSDLSSTGALNFNINSVGAASLRLEGSLTTTIAGYRAANSGENRHIALRRSSGAMTAWSNGISQTLTTPSGAGAWSDSVDAQYLIAGIRTATTQWKGRIGRVILVLGALTDAEILTHAQTGLLPDWCAFTGSAVPSSINTFDSEHASWSSVGGVAALADNAGYAALSGLSASVDAGRVETNRFASAPLQSRVYFELEYRSSGTGSLNVGFPLDYKNFGLTHDGAWHRITGYSQVTGFSSSPTYIRFCIWGSVAALDIRNCYINFVGPIARHRIQPGAWVMPDDGDNGIPLIITSGVKALGEKLNEIVLPGLAMTADGFVHLDQIITPTGYELTGFVARQTGTETSDITIKETSSGGTTLATATLSATNARVKGAIVAPFDADNRKLWLGNSAWAGNTVTPFFVFRRSLAA